jgi:hypothetical protein
VKLIRFITVPEFDGRFAPDDIIVWMERSIRKDIYHWMLVALDSVDSGSSFGPCIKLKIILPLFGG